MTLAPAQATPTDYKMAMSRLASGVSLITVYDDDGRPRGMTASAVTSLSVEPVQLLVCISTHLATHELIRDRGRFAVNVLGEGGEELALRFADPTADRFAGVELQDDGGAPILSDAIATFDCEVSDVLPGGDHSIFLGRVQSCEHVPDALPLVYWGSRFAALAER